MPNVTAIPDTAPIWAALRTRLLALSPRAFEYFAGDLLTYLGLHEVRVTRYVGDAGLDAEAVLDMGPFRIPTAVQVKRYRKNVLRPDIDRFVGALSPRYAHGIFITNGQFSKGARTKLNDPVPHIHGIDGDQIIHLMLHYQIGVVPDEHALATLVLDERYFADFESRAHPSRLAEQPDQGYHVAPAPEPEPPDLISVRALAYALRVDPNTIRDWVAAGKLSPDQTIQRGSHTTYAFRRERVELLRTELGLAELPQDAVQWRQAFLAFMGSERLTKSYKPVLFKAIVATLDRNGQAQMAAVAQAFRAFYVQRKQAGLPPEYNSPLADDPAAVSDAAVQALIEKYPLDRFLIQQLMHYDRDAGLIQFHPTLWASLRYADMLDALARADEQIARYYGRHAAP
ncbi:MAG: restriction endonuclease [Chloroflexaceae bacterium]|nr:restriction endonuclease [Chloroflexaceae bacterium]